jgi:predicted nucleic acid-binding protein
MPYVVLDTDVASRIIKRQLSGPLAAKLTGRPRPVNDTWIAACCLVHGLPLATFNMKDYTDFAEHEGLQILGHNDR